MDDSDGVEKIRVSSHGQWFTTAKPSGQAAEAGIAALAKFAGKSSTKSVASAKNPTNP
ncbi:hypothetical protein [Hymenobacter antarcticus]|uniref:hypothetical protein n=1 Tax=Hymenobacter antarcticus TaxID=486270 RepID=UPI0031EBB749